MPDGDWGEEYLRAEDERKRQGERAETWKQRAEQSDAALTREHRHTVMLTDAVAQRDRTIAELRTRTADAQDAATFLLEALYEACLVVPVRPAEGRTAAQAANVERFTRAMVDASDWYSARRAAGR